MSKSKFLDLTKRIRISGSGSRGSLFENLVNLKQPCFISVLNDLGRVAAVDNMSLENITRTDSIRCY